MALRPEILKSWPPQGWQFYQSETNWHAPNPLQFTFEQQVRNIIAMRQQNPRFGLATDFVTVARELENYTEARIGAHDKFSIQPEDPAQKKTLALSNHPLNQNPDDAAAEDSPVDTAALREWLGAGGQPVAKELAESRASVCAGCSENSSAPACKKERKKSLNDWLTAVVAVAFKQMLQLANRKRYSTSRDAELGKCLACRCELKLKVHTPISHIKDNMEPDVVAKLRSVKNCWVMTEQ